MLDSDNLIVGLVVIIVFVLSSILVIGLCVTFAFFDDDNDGNFDFKSNTINSTSDFIITEKHLMYFNSAFPIPVYSVVDTETGVEYLTISSEYWIPRYNTDGEIIIHQDLITSTFS